MYFKDWQKAKRCNISPTLLWEYDTNSADWDWNHMKITVVTRVIESGRKNDYYAMLQLYGGYYKVREIVKEIPKLSHKDMNWVCTLFNLKKEDLKCYTRMLSRKKLSLC
jgi:hypothetical protein